MDSTNCLLSKKRKEDTIEKKNINHTFPFIAFKEKEGLKDRQTVDGRWRAGGQKERRKKDDFSKAQLFDQQHFFSIFFHPYD